MIKSYTAIIWLQAGESLMRMTQVLTITLPHDMLEMVRAKVTRGEYATESEVIRDGLLTLQPRDAAVEKWLHDECEAYPLAVPQAYNSRAKLDETIHCHLLTMGRATSWQSLSLYRRTWR